ncbi:MULTISPECIES: hypothetical protein [unclassified Nocardioides]|uniref:hypothetical protein n=1 Tax=unclassified Nocardioides TaxID=2615069 RepID=UPI0036068796
MNSNQIWMTAQTPSRFCAPISGHAFGGFTPAIDARTTAAVVRERAVIAATKGGVKGDMGLAQSYFPGTSAWRPPTC